MTPFDQDEGLEHWSSDDVVEGAMAIVIDARHRFEHTDVDYDPANTVEALDHESYTLARHCPACRHFHTDTEGCLPGFGRLRCGRCGTPHYGWEPCDKRRPDRTAWLGLGVLTVAALVIAGGIKAAEVLWEWL